MVNNNQTKTLSVLFFSEWLNIVLTKKTDDYEKIKFSRAKGQSVLGQCFWRCHDCIGNIRAIVNLELKYWIIYVWSVIWASCIWHRYCCRDWFCHYLGFRYGNRWLRCRKTGRHGRNDTRIFGLGHHTDCCCSTGSFFGCRCGKNDGKCAWGYFISYR